MGKDYRHRGNKPEKFEDGFELFKDNKLPSYDRNKNRKQNKINLNHFDVVVIEEDDFQLEETDEE